MKMFVKKRLVLLIAVALLLTATVSSTVAYLVAGTDEVTNVFTPGNVETEITENFEGKTVKRDIKVQNKGNIDVFVRVAVVGNWCDVQGKVIESWLAPDSLGPDWKKHTDGFYYYTKVLPAGSTTDSAVFAAEINGTDNTRPGQRLVVTVIHQSIQAQPANAVTETWSVNPTTLK